MKAVSKIALLAPVAVVIAVMGAFTAGVIFADQYTYLGMDKHKQIIPSKSRLNTLPENYATVAWTLGSDGATTTWWASPSVKPLVETALTSWAKNDSDVFGVELGFCHQFHVHCDQPLGGHKATLRLGNRDL